GTPHGRGGGDLSPAGRAANVAHVAVVFWLDGGVALATEVLHARSGAALDPAFVARAVGLLPSLELGDPWFEERSASAAAALDPGPAVSADSVAVAFGEFGDLQSPFTRGHSGRVAAVADAAAATLGTDAADRQTLRWAAHLHDLGQVAIPTALWLVPRPWRAVERARTLSHPQVTERVLAGAPAFAAAARVAGQHHERPDGAGYPRGLGGASVPRLARILAAADVVVALAEPRPHRPAFEGSRLGAEVEAVVRAGGLDGDCAEAALAAVGQRRREPLSGPVAELTPREVQVLRLVALGRTNKEVASTLGISDRTVQHHTIRIYEKLGIDTRAAAGLIAARNGLV
ncbi:MAG: HD domain-containing phosphohydrolase, partial [Myxococcota bacterium]